jgi:hypothetical protein
VANPIQKKSYIAGATALTPNSIVKFSASETVVLAAADTDALIGVTDAFCNPAVGDRLDVMHDGIADVIAGGIIARGDIVTSDASGHAVTWTTGRKLGVALETAAAGDLIPVELSLG